MTVDPLADDLAVAALALARRFAAGATMWCASPRWPSHAQHVAVEFVHPVIVGKRALPAVHVSDTDIVAGVRMLARPGDIVCVLGTAGDADLAALARRADAWGLTSVWIGAGPRPEPHAADHVLWTDGPDDAALVRRYHLLWELTHVVFEHPGLLAPPSTDDACGADVCITCSDEGVLAEVATVLDGHHALVRAAGRSETIDTTLVDALRPGDLVLVHAGTALTRVEETGRHSGRGGSVTSGAANRPASCTRSSTRRSTTPTRCSRTSRARLGPRPPRARSCKRRRSPRARTRSRWQVPRWPRGCGAADGCSRSGTAAARPMRMPRPSGSNIRIVGTRCPHAPSLPTARC